MLADTAEVNNPQNLEMHKSDLELWRLLKYNFDCAPAFNVISILESIRNTQEAKKSKIYCRKSTSSKDDMRNATDKL